jgi:hypothetical protein
MITPHINILANAELQLSLFIHTYTALILYRIFIYLRYFDNNSPGFTSVYTQIQPGNGGRIATPSTNLNDYQTVDIITSRTHQMRLQKADTNFDSERGENDTILRPQTYPAQHLHM